MEKPDTTYKDIEFTYYDEKMAISPFGLPNMGSICHFNAIYQALVSCTGLLSKLQTGTRKFGSAMKDCLKNHDSIALWEILRKSVANRKDRVLFTYGHQSASEGLVLILEQLGSSIDILFQNRTKNSIFCTHDEPVSTKYSEEFILSLPNTKLSLAGSEIINYFMRNTDTVDDFKCVKCGSMAQKKILSQLVMVPEILIFLNKKYTNERRVLESGTKFEEFIEIKGKTKMKYRAVAYIQHSGSLSGGHYWAVCLRKTGVGSGLEWYELNDGSVGSTKFMPDRNTYMVFYHIYR